MLNIKTVEVLKELADSVSQTGGVENGDRYIVSEAILIEYELMRIAEIDTDPAMIPHPCALGDQWAKECCKRWRKFKPQQ